MRKRTAAAVVLIAALVVAAAAAARSAHSAGPTKITVWAGWSAGHELKVFKQVVAEYDKKHPEVTINVVGGIDDNKIVAAIRSGTAPDVVSSFNSYNVGIYCGTGGWIDLGPLMSKAHIAASEFPPATQYYTQYNGKRCALPLLADTYGLYYNKALFKKAGLNPSSPPKTWAQFLAACAALKKAGIVPISAGFKEGYYAEWWVDVLSMQLMTPSELAQNYSKPNWESPAISKAWSLLLDLVKKGYMTPNAEALPLFPDTVNNFGAGKAAIILALSANNANYSEFRKDRVSPNLGAFLPPLVPGAKIKKQVFDFGPGLSWIVSSWSKHSKEAYDYLTYLGQPKTQETIFKLSGTFPNNRLAKPKTSDKVGNQILGWIRAYPAYVGQVTLIRSNVEAVYDKTVPQVITGDQSVADAMKQVQAEQDRATPIPTK
jgi:ABC-type glycerol-3-phosphate transport system substrate-binding protein